MKTSLLVLPLLAASLTVAAQSPITLTQATFPATSVAGENYQDATLPSGTTATATGANQSWDYRNLVASGSPYLVAYGAVPANSPVAGAQWTRYRSIPVGSPNGFFYYATSYYALGTGGRLELGRSVARTALSISQTTGGANDSVVVNRQSTTFGNGFVSFPLPLTAGNSLRRTLRTAVTGTITAAAFGLNKTPFRIVHRYIVVDSVAGWGTARVPVAGSSTGSPAIAVLQVRRSYVQQDSVYLNGSAAPALLLAPLGITQGGVTAYYYDAFWRTGSAQPVLELYYPNNQFGTPNSADYSTESTLLATRPVAAASLGMQAYPNPVAAGAPLVLAANGQPQAVTLTVRDALGRQLVAGPGTTGQPTALLAGLPAGVYLLEAALADGRRTMQHIAVQ